MSEFPSIEAQELVTKDFLRAELAQLESKLTLRIGAAAAAQSGVMVALLALFR